MKSRRKWCDVTLVFWPSLSGGDNVVSGGQCTRRGAVIWCREVQKTMCDVCCTGRENSGGAL